MKNIILCFFIGLFFISCKDNSNTPKSNLDSKFDYSILDNLSKFYLLEGNVDNVYTMVYITISKNKDLDNQDIAQIDGKYISNNNQYILRGNIDKSNLMTLEFISESGESFKSFEGNIMANGFISGKFIDDNVIKSNTEVLFTPINNKINDISLINASISKKHIDKDYDGSNKEYSYNASKQVALINNANTKVLQKINLFFIGDNASNIKENIENKLLNTYEDNKGPFNYESIDKLEVKYIDDRILVFNNYIYVYSGGAHGSYGDEMIAFSLDSGDRIPNDLSLLLKDENDVYLKKMILNKLISENNLIDLNESDFSLSKFRIDSNGIEFYWGLYEIAPYAEGVVSVKFDFSQIAPFIREDSIYYYLFNKGNKS
ncbi:PdaC/SigV domain-containing protein [Helicobacter sp. MIT 14-3879]|uniref:DUF3298 and DUF4163 domain-containing protein n=1 Tax=Helicobacter sp. MIT 14-3879 TaxID=2040649 RepID=UPI000E1F6860|nr:DUF4163 domain-containing protein [Helicobacter sp. MIT 14-3879]RDU65481.1 hypothetical protein CQA44_00360 [Helicobacter sp. MIT 14-3879]